MHAITKSEKEGSKGMKATAQSISVYGDAVHARHTIGFPNGCRQTILRLPQTFPIQQVLN
jgi:hypothetical protein